MRTIVVGVEESERSLGALALARRIAGRSGPDRAAALHFTPCWPAPSPAA